MKQFIDVLLDMKLDECDKTIKEVHAQIEEIGRREPYVKKGTKAYDDLEQEFFGLVVRRATLENAKFKLLSVYTRRNMDAFFKEYPTFEDFMARGVEAMIIINKKGEQNDV